MNGEALDDALGNGEIYYELNDALGMIFGDWELDTTDDELNDAVHAVVNSLKGNR